MSKKSSGGCIGLGSVCAVILSAALNHSLLWGILPALRAMFL